MIQSVTVATSIAEAQQGHTHIFADTCIPKVILTDGDKAQPLEPSLIIV